MYWYKLCRLPNMIHALFLWFTATINLGYTFIVKCVITAVMSQENGV